MRLVQVSLVILVSALLLICFWGAVLAVAGQALEEPTPLDAFGVLACGSLVIALQLLSARLLGSGHEAGQLATRAASGNVPAAPFLSFWHSFWLRLFFSLVCTVTVAVVLLHGVVAFLV